MSERTSKRVERSGGGTSKVERLNRVTGDVVDAAVRLHSRLGPGLLESVYEVVLARDLVRRGHRVERQKAVSFEYDGMWFENAFRPDLVIDRAVVVEVKSAAAVSAAHRKQLLTYLRILDHRVGLLLNFGAPLLKDGISRVVNDL